MDDSDAAVRLAEHLADAGRYTDAERIMRTALGQAPDNAELLTTLAYLLRAQERYRDALAVADAAVASAPEHGSAHAERACILIDIHRGAEAITAATEAVRLGPHVADRHLVLARALSADDRLDEARETAREALRLTPRSASALLTLAEVERLAGNHDVAADTTRQALAIDPSSTCGRQVLAMLDADRGVVRRSMRTLAEIARDRPADPDLFWLLWPIRRVVAAPRWWLPGGAAIVAGTGLVAAAVGDSAALEHAARVAAVLTCVVTAGFMLRILVPAGRLPWQALRLAPSLVRRSLVVGLAVIAGALGLLGGYAAGAPLALPILTMAAAPMLWTCMTGEMLGQALSDAGARQFLQDRRQEAREVLRDLRAWPAETRRELHAAWHATDADDAERKSRQAALRRSLAVYQNRARNTILSAAFAIVTVLAVSAAVASWPSTGTTVGLWLFALLTLNACVRTAVMKAVATPEGLILHGPLWKAIIRWDRVAKVVSDDPQTTSGLIPVRAPVLLLPDGRRFRVKQTVSRPGFDGHIETWEKIQLCRHRRNTPMSCVSVRPGWWSRPAETRPVRSARSGGSPINSGFIRRRYAAG